MVTIKTYIRKENRLKIALNIIVILLLLLWVPVSIEKLVDFPSFKRGIYNQPLGNSLATILIYAIPFLEVLTVFALISERFRKQGFLLSIALMAAFTTYIGVALLGAWENLPCACGSVIKGMSWSQHFLFNLFFLILSILGFLLQNKHQGSSAQSIATEGKPAKWQRYNKISNL